MPELFFVQNRAILSPGLEFADPGSRWGWEKVRSRKLGKSLGRTVTEEIKLYPEADSSSAGIISRPGEAQVPGGAS